MRRKLIAFQLLKPHYLLIDVVVQTSTLPSLNCSLSGFTPFPYLLVRVKARVLHKRDSFAPLLSLTEIIKRSRLYKPDGNVTT